MTKDKINFFLKKPSHLKLIQLTFDMRYKAWITQQKQIKKLKVQQFNVKWWKEKKIIEKDFKKDWT